MSRERRSEQSQRSKRSEQAVAGLEEAILTVLPADWASTRQIQRMVRTERWCPPMHAVASALRVLRRDGVAERVSQGRAGHWWRRAR